MYVHIKLEYAQSHWSYAKGEIERIALTIRGLRNVGIWGLPWMSFFLSLGIKFKDGTLVTDHFIHFLVINPVPRAFWLCGPPRKNLEKIYISKITHILILRRTKFVGSLQDHADSDFVPNLIVHLTQKKCLKNSPKIIILCVSY